MFISKSLKSALFRKTSAYRFASATPTNPPGCIIGNRERINIFAKNYDGILSRILSVFHFNKVPLTQVQTKLLNMEPSGEQEAFFSIDIEGSRSDPKAQKALAELNFFSRASVEQEIPEVPWFPVNLSDLDSIGKLADVSTQEGGKDHPGFNDPDYRVRREYLGKVTFDYRMGNAIPKIAYTDNENKTWASVWDRLRPLQEKIMCKQFNDNIKNFEKAGVYQRNKIPQLEDINNFLIDKTGFRLKPVSGILSQREFLNSLALRVFCSTQYIRHHSVPEYTPEPDIIHELLGHVPMFADPDFADLSQQIGLLSLGNNEENITKLAALYWYTVEFGVCREGKEIKGYGAGVASSIGEIENVGKGGSEYRPLNPFKELPLNYPIQTLQPIYYTADTFKSAGDILVKYGEFLPKPFKCYFNRKTNTVEVDRKVKLVSIEEKSLSF